jgi:hypothetical protein
MPTICVNRSGCGGVIPTVAGETVHCHQTTNALDLTDCRAHLTVNAVLVGTSRQDLL